MILYLDASALVKRYIAEQGTAEVASAIREAEIIGTSVISRAETVAALAKAVRVGALVQEEAAVAREAFQGDWSKLVCIQATENLLAEADALAWELGLRGYDFVQLVASALIWKDNMVEPFTFAMFDRRLWVAATQVGLIPFPDDLFSLLERWKS